MLSCNLMKEVKTVFEILVVPEIYTPVRWQNLNGAVDFHYEGLLDLENLIL